MAAPGSIARPWKLPFLLRDLHSHVTPGYLGPPEWTSQTAPQSVQPFLQGSQSVPHRDTHIGEHSNRATTVVITTSYAMHRDVA